VDPLGHGAVRGRHLGDLREEGFLLVRLLAAASGALELLGALLHRVAFLGGETLVLLVSRHGSQRREPPGPKLLET
jgi:hypothetical protein